MVSTDLLNIDIGGSVSNCKGKGVGSLGVDLICTLSIGSWVRYLLAQPFVVQMLPNRVILLTLLGKNVLCESQETAKNMSRLLS